MNSYANYLLSGCVKRIFTAMVVGFSETDTYVLKCIVYNQSVPGSGLSARECNALDFVSFSFLCTFLFLATCAKLS